MIHRYKTQGTCSREIEIHINDADGTIERVSFAGGCNGNLQGLDAMVRGLKPQEVIARLEGIRCGSKDTSCPDQLAKALRETINDI